MSANARNLALMWLLVGSQGACVSDQGVSDASVVGIGDGVSVPISPPEVLDRHIQPDVRDVDLLFVVDNSCSMGEEQELLATNFAYMLDVLLDTELAWRAGVITTDVRVPDQAGKLMEHGGLRWVEPTTPNLEDTFASLVSVGTDGSGEERGREAAYKALIPGVNPGFRRDDADLHITVVSDEDDSSRSRVLPLDDWIRYLRQLRGQGPRVSVSSVVGPIFGCPNAVGGVDYQEVTERIGGVFWPLCQEPWSALMEELAWVAVPPRAEFVLSRIPIPETLTVRVESAGAVQGFTVPDEVVWNPTRNSVQFLEYEPAPGAVIELRYTTAEIPAPPP